MTISCQNIHHLKSPLLRGSVLNDPSSSKVQRQLAGSVISQSRTERTTGSELESVASKVLQSEKYNDTTKTLAGSVLSQSVKSK